MASARYLNKVKSKVQTAWRKGSDPVEDLEDVLFELHIGYLLHRCGHFSDIEYEKYGQVGPDYTVSLPDQSRLNLEVKRIREGAPERSIEALKAEICEEIAASKIPSGLDLHVRLLGDDELAPSLAWLKRLQEAKAHIVRSILEATPPDEAVPMDGGKTYPVPGFEGELELCFRRPSGQCFDHLRCDFSETPVFLTQFEYQKFRSDVLAKIRSGQFLTGDVNVLVLTTASITHGDSDFERAMSDIGQHIEEKDSAFFEQRGFKNLEDFDETGRRCDEIR